jgi:hypothetical protein
MGWIDARRLRRSARLLGMLACFAVGLECQQAPSRERDEAFVLMYRALRLDESAAWNDEVRHRLGCGRCESFEVLDRRGNPATYLFNADATWTISAREIVDALIGDAPDGKFVLVLRLSSSGRTRLGDIVSANREAVTVNEIGGKRVGLVPLMLVQDQYVAGQFDDLQAAKEAARAMGVPFQVDVDGERGDLRSSRALQPRESARTPDSPASDGGRHGP